MKGSSPGAEGLYSGSTGAGLFDLWESLGLFEGLEPLLPAEFSILFEIARVVPLHESSLHLKKALDSLISIDIPASDSDTLQDRHQLMLRTAPAGDIMDLGKLRNIDGLKRILPRELALDTPIFDAKLVMKSLLVMNYRENSRDRFMPVPGHGAGMRGTQAGREQNLYILLDRSRSMDQMYRSFYSRYIVAEYLRRKRSTSAVIWFRPFDSVPGELFKIDKSSDFPRLIEQVMMAGTGGSGTDLNGALLQAARDMEFHGGAMEGEILAVTDGLAPVDRYGLKKALRGARLNILKIGSDSAGSDYNSLKQVLDRAGFSMDLSKIDLRGIGRNIKEKEKSDWTASEKGAYKAILAHVEGLRKDLAETADRFIEIPDLDTGLLFNIAGGDLPIIEEIIARIEGESQSYPDPARWAGLYRMSLALGMYIESIISSRGMFTDKLSGFLLRLSRARHGLLKYPGLLYRVKAMKNYGLDKKNIAIALKDVKAGKKRMERNNRKLSIHKIGSSIAGKGSGRTPFFYKMLSLFMKCISDLRQIALSFFKIHK